MLAKFLTARPQEEIAVPFAEHPPIYGMDDNEPLYNMPAGTAIYLYNMVPGAYGAQTREGFREWAINLAGGAVKGLVPFVGKSGDLSQSKLFAVTQNGIYDVSTRGTDNPTAVVTFADQTSAAGFTHFFHFTDAAGNQTVFVSDSRNGLYEYNPAGPTWTKYTATELQGVDPTKVAFVTGHKGRLWFIERDAADAWYLPTGQKQGLATNFQFGSKFKHGGELVGLYTWTIDAGRGMDDFLIGVSRAGDLLAYQGTDPASSSTWGLTGSWFVGRVPKGRRVAQESGGDLLILSVFGAFGVTALMQGLEPSRIERNITGKISDLLQRELRTKVDEDYWQISMLPEEESLVINIPTIGSAAPIQPVLNVNRVYEGPGGGWGIWRGIPATVWEAFLGNAFFGDTNGKVYQMNASLDYVPLDDSTGNPIEFSVLGRYTDFGVPGYHKQVQFLRPAFRSANVTFDAKTLYDFNVQELLSSGSSNPLGASGVWDLSNWDQAIWSGVQVLQKTTGGEGYGRNVAIAIRGTTNNRTVLANVEGTWTRWGFL